MRPPSKEALERECAAFNARCAVGDRVAVRMDSGSATITTTRTPAQILSGHDTKTMREIIRLRRMEKHARDEAAALLDTYKTALGLG